MLHILLQSIIFSACTFHVAAHGFLAHPGNLKDAFSKHAVRNYDAIDNNIDSLRSPIKSDSPVCRGAAKGPVTDIRLENGKSFTITIAFSIGAQHIGPCGVEILDENLENAVQIAHVDGPGGCAQKPLSQFATDKSSPASSQCPNNIPTKLVTDDMCLSEWTFVVSNVEKIKCTNCVMRWTWSGQHISVTNPEKYETCADVRISSSGAPSTDTPDPAATTTDPVVTTIDSTTTTTSSTVSSAPRKTLSPKKRPTKKTKSSTQLPTKNTSAPAETSNPQPSGLTAGVAECNKMSDKCSFQMACTADKQGFFACFAKESNRAPIRMDCAPGTTCKQNGQFISCQPA
ncbi:expressed protein [Batrachochytrium dendrobatidis JAM81]|uniref:Expressed protein n=2 Tax=Batrachochytrium dendrobatidis TaxID=109871 RepID=F4NXR9_BATDJ|nr:uncharacterized protein BATDEDRAFT_36743 [Batrachochytrium dendrobatidis JAM81]EGF81896.1 expressed protein [Batrachochytrium dendrobatidis JAM81]KAK5670773.1 hypothetical protein QVD99_002544 [Batrachochytrium dendrobatidis]OAJ40557.1 hypothetical protein BDEG_24275 [Batrachochytrium dendrobatidis JEL423]|eukprot:XP_006677483.1 expressed protein [Batrachochytrium dendrobatidis JAM81]